jgi:hypothetical protein
MVRVIVYSATLNNISVISWWSVLLVEKTEYPEKTIDLSQVCVRMWRHVYPRTVVTVTKSVGQVHHH